MRIDFRALPGEADLTPRPVLDVWIQGMGQTAVGCLVDTGALGNRFDAGLATQAGIQLDGPEERLVIGRHAVTARTVIVGLRVGDFDWEAPVSFCTPWRLDFQLLGQEGFLRWFRLTFEVANRWMEVDPQD